MEDTRIKGIESLAIRYAEIRDERITLNKEEVALKQQLLSAMKTAHKKVYHRDKIDVRIVPEGETVKVKIKAEKEAGE